MTSKDKSPTDPHIYVFIAGENLARANESGDYCPASLETEGFIHASAREHLHRVANKFYASTNDVRLLKIDPALVTAEIRWEPAAGSLYPHIYGPLNMSEVVRVTGVGRNGDGTLAPEVDD